MRLAMLVCVAACGSPDNTQHPDAPKSIDAAIDAHHDIDAPPPPARQGQITLAESNVTGQAPSSNVDVVFSDGPPMGDVTGTDGPCTAYGATMSAMRHAAGTITVTGTTTSLTLTAGTDGHYTSSPAAPTDLFAVGATLHVAAAGSSDFAAFAGDVIAPGTVAGFTAPASISRAAGTTLTWTAATSSVMQVVIAAFTGQTAGILFCRVPDNGSFAVPPSSLALLPPAATTAIVLLGRTNETMLTTASGKVSLQAVSAVGNQNVTVTN